MEAQLGLIGGTMGLLTGFSILSGVEIVYFLVRFLGFMNNISNIKFSVFMNNVSMLRFFISLKTQRSEVVANARKRFENHLTRND